MSDFKGWEGRRGEGRREGKVKGREWEVEGGIWLRSCRGSPMSYEVDPTLLKWGPNICIVPSDLTDRFPGIVHT